jgi:hypothetical protein
MDPSSAGQAASILIRTKLSFPSLSPNLVSRPHLIDRLYRGFDPLILNMFPGNLQFPGIIIQINNSFYSSSIDLIVNY